MKALIFNSGMGTRMGALTSERPKCLVRLPNRETILARQLRILMECGITDAVITTGAYTAEIEDEVHRTDGIHLEFAENTRFAQTNYIYSMHLASPLLDDDILMLHGDLVFDRDALMRLLDSPEPDACMVSFTAELPEKDFKGRLDGQILREVSVGIFGEDCFALQPMYKLSRRTVKLWCDKIAEFVAADNCRVYAENALNELLGELSIKAVLYDGCLLSEIDDVDDLFRVGTELLHREYSGFGDISELPKLVGELGGQRAFAVVGRHCEELFRAVMSGIDDLRIFTDYRENPDISSIETAARAFSEHRADLLISVGGGSVIDTAKGIKALTNADIPHISVPTTAGSGSEATQFAVYYIDGMKQSFSAPNLLPERVLLDEKLLATLDRGQRSATLLDALCHAIESLMSTRATDESRSYAETALELINGCFTRFFDGDEAAFATALAASDIAGRAINISRTAAGHAMSYVLTSRFGVKHGRAAAVCLKCILGYLSEKGRLDIDIKSAYELLCAVYENADFAPIDGILEVSAEELAQNVNEERLANFTIKLSADDITAIYRQIITELC